ncbi:hypothetical protein PINS_up003316 [Pythium insidiosum]|nr:hypothetical protein PINS_up003316 [Pythium insidiosum]
MADDSLSLSRIFGASPNAVDALASPVALRRMTSASSTASVRRMTTFSDFLSDDSDDNKSRRSSRDSQDSEFDGEDDDEDDATARALQRMQGLEDDMTYVTPAFLLESPNDSSATAAIAASSNTVTLQTQPSSWQGQDQVIDTSFRLSSPNAGPSLIQADGQHRQSNDSYDTSLRLQSPSMAKNNGRESEGDRDSYDASFRVHSLITGGQTPNDSGDSFDESFRLHSLPIEDDSKSPATAEGSVRGSNDSYDTSFRLHSPAATEREHGSGDSYDTSFRLQSPPDIGTTEFSFGPTSFTAINPPTDQDEAPFGSPEVAAFYDDNDDDALDDPRRLSEASSSSSSSESEDYGFGAASSVDGGSFSSTDTNEPRTFFVDSVDSISVLDLPASPTFPAGVSTSVTSLPANEAPSLAFSLSDDVQATDTTDSQPRQQSISSSISSSTSSSHSSIDDASFSSHIDDSFTSDRASLISPSSAAVGASTDAMLLSFVSTSSASTASREADTPSITSELPAVVPVRIIHTNAQPPSASASTSPPIAVSIDSSRPSSDVSLDFTGIYLGDTSDSGRGRPHPHPHPHPHPLPRPLSTSSSIEITRPPPLRRVVSAQQASEAKVADFFRRTYHQRLDEDNDPHYHGSLIADLPGGVLASRHRSKTTLAGPQRQADYEVLPMGRSRRSSTSAVRLMDLGHLQAGQRVEDVLDGQQRLSRGSRRTATRVNEELLEPPASPTKPSQRLLPAAVLGAVNASPPTAADNLGENDQVVPRSLYISFDDSAAQPDSPLLEPPHFLLSPEPPRHQAGSGSPERSVSALPSLSVTPSAALGAAAIAAASPLVSLSASKVGGADVAPGFRWQQQQQEKLSDDASSPGIKESIWHVAGALSIGGGRPSTLSLAQRLSASLRRTLGLAPSGAAAAAGQVTSPKSVVSAPPRLPRGYDDRGFYASFGNIPCGDRAIVVGKPGRSLRLSKADKLRQRQLQRRALWLMTALLVGVALGVLLIHVDGRPSALVPSSETQRNDEIPVALRWILLPSELFWRCWSCVTLPLLVCYVINGLAELTMTRKASLVLGVRSLAYLLLTSSVATLEGVSVAAVVHWLGVLPSSTALSPTVVSAHTRRVNGTAAFVCAKELSYLQTTTDGQSFRCSNASLSLPVESAIPPNGSITASAALFVMVDRNNIHNGRASQPTSARFGGPSASLPDASPLSAVIRALASDLVPANAAQVFASALTSHVLSAVALALVLGLVVGTRARIRSLQSSYSASSASASLPPPPPLSASASVSLPPPTKWIGPHPVLAVTIEIQTLLEWLASAFQPAATIAALSLGLGHVLLYREDVLALSSSALWIGLAVAATAAVHVGLVTPLLTHVAVRSRAWRTLPATAPGVVFSAVFGNSVLAVPVLAACFPSAQLVTKSMAQVGVGLSCALQNNGHALYVPLALVFLAASSGSAGALHSWSAWLWLALLTLLSCFVSAIGEFDVRAGAIQRPRLRLVLSLFAGGSC